MRPRRVDLLYLLCVVLLAALFLGDVATRALDGGGRTTSPVVGTAGQPRDVNVDLMRERIRQGRLSDHEALHARPVDAGGGSLRVPEVREDR